MIEEDRYKTGTGNGAKACVGSADVTDLYSLAYRGMFDNADM